MDEPIFYFDFGSLNAYLAWRLLPEIEQRTGARFDQMPVLLGGIFKATGNRSPVEAYAGVPAKLAYEFREIDRFIARHGLDEFSMNPHFPVNTLALMRGAVAAERDGAVRRPMWPRSSIICGRTRASSTTRPSWRGRSRKPGCRPKSCWNSPETRTVKDRLIANTREAVELGVFGLPSFIVGGELFFGKDRLREVEEAILGG